ncbi:Aste57867_14994 [Aphanomyces stellatus]|uniref:Aste57867_14994 protein n=1 Tax=Aphanomyces stellatus TaxID=120398 RepID=A0A485L2Z2_9STRA|nr:hypothetical protein As57867_014938 [Aphanomyces stellatus]VFT91808.1 Aste57867_14994 [Aphanomyces stellatus]
MDLRGATTFFAALWSCQTLENLVLSESKIPSLDAIPFGVSSITISHLNLDGVWNGRHQQPEDVLPDVLALVQGIAHSTRYHILSIAYNHIRPVVVKELMQAIVHSNVRELNLGGIDLEDAGCIVVAQCLSQTKPTKLDLRCNRITGVGALELAAALTPFPQLRSLSLASNKIDSSGVAAVIVAMGSHSGHGKLDVIQNFEDDNTTYLRAVAARFAQLDTRLPQLDDWLDVSLGW